MSHEIQITRAGVDRIAGIVGLAEVIWNHHYPAILSQEQIDFMLSRMYAEPLMREEMLHRGIQYYLASRGSEPVGFASVGPASPPTTFKLHKLYVHPAVQGQGVGRRLLEAALRLARDRGADRLALCVNKRNTQARLIYEKWGFINRRSVCLDIGGGFVMDDYEMELVFDALADPGPAGHEH